MSKTVSPAFSTALPSKNKNDHAINHDRVLTTKSRACVQCVQSSCNHVREKSAFMYTT